MIKIHCLSCGHTLDLDETYSDYEGQVKCYACSVLLEVKMEENLIKKLEQSPIRDRHEETLCLLF